MFFFFPQSVLSSLQLLNMALWQVQATSTALSINLAASVGIPSWEKIFCTVQRKACGMGVFLNVSKVKRSDSMVITSIIKNWKLRASLVIYHLIFNAHSWNNCLLSGTAWGLKHTITFLAHMQLLLLWRLSQTEDILARFREFRQQCPSAIITNASIRQK